MKLLRRGRSSRGVVDCSSKERSTFVGNKTALEDITEAAVSDISSSNNDGSWHGGCGVDVVDEGYLSQHHHDSEEKYNGKVSSLENNRKQNKKKKTKLKKNQKQANKDREGVVSQRNSKGTKDDGRKFSKALLVALNELQSELRSKVSECEALQETVSTLSNCMTEMDKELQDKSCRLEKMELKLQAVTFIDKRDLMNLDAGKRYYSNEYNVWRHDDGAATPSTTGLHDAMVVTDHQNVSTTSNKNEDKRSKKKTNALMEQLLRKVASDSGIEFVEESSGSDSDSDSCSSGCDSEEEEDAVDGRDESYGYAHEGETDSGTTATTTTTNNNNKAALSLEDLNQVDSEEQEPQQNSEGTTASTTTSQRQQQQQQQGSRAVGDGSHSVDRNNVAADASTPGRAAFYGLILERDSMRQKAHRCMIEVKNLRDDNERLRTELTIYQNRQQQQRRQSCLRCSVERRVSWLSSSRIDEEGSYDDERRGYHSDGWPWSTASEPRSGRQITIVSVDGHEQHDHDQEEEYAITRMHNRRLMMQGRGHNILRSNIHSTRVMDAVDTDMDYEYYAAIAGDHSERDGVGGGVDVIAATDDSDEYFAAIATDNADRAAGGGRSNRINNNNVESLNRRIYQFL